MLTPAEQLYNNQVQAEGFYIFGGQDQNGQLLNDLWLLEPDYAKNSECLTSGAYCDDEKKLYLQATQIEDYQGRPPCPRT